MVKKSEVTHLLKFARLLDGFAIFNYAISDLGLDGRVNFTVGDFTYSLNKYTGEVEYCGVRVKFPTLRQIISNLPIIKVIQCEGVEIPVSFNAELSKFELGTTAEIVDCSSVFSGFDFSDDSFETDSIPEVTTLDLAVEKVADFTLPASETLPEAVVAEVTPQVDETLTLESLNLPVFFCQQDSEKKEIKKPADITSAELIPFLDAWLQVRGYKNQFLEALKSGVHNSLVMSPYPAIEFVIDSSGQLKKKLIRSENIGEIKNRAGSIIERTGRASSPLYSSLFYISPIRVKDSKGNVYLAQTYLKKVQGEFGTYWEQQSQKIAWFDGGSLHYYDKNNPEILVEHNLHPVIEANGVDIFPDLSVRQISLENLSNKSGEYSHEWETTKDLRFFDSVNQKPIEGEEAARTSEKNLVKPRVFLGFEHPNLKPKKVQAATITERKIPKPTKLDGARTNHHEYQLRQIIGNIPMILTFKNSDSRWDVIALPIKVSPYHLTVYLSDKIGSTELLGYIATHTQELSCNLAKIEVQVEEVKEQITDLADDVHFLPRGRSLQAKIESLFKVRDNIAGILSSLEALTLNVKQNRKPDRLDVLESTKTIQKLLQDSHIKPESSYTDDYYCWHNIGSLRILEQVERVNHTYSMTILGSEKDTRRSKIPMVMNWLRAVPTILQNHFGETYPTNEEIKAHLMSIYPFYKRKLREGDKLDKSYVNLEADMIVKTKGRLIIEVYFDNALQTSQLISITKPVDNKSRQGKIPVKISSTFEVDNLDGLIHLLRCDDRKQIIETQNHINKLIQKFVNSNIQLFTREREDKIISKVATKDLLGFSKESKGFPQIVKEYNRFVTPLTSESEICIGKLVNLLTLETFDRHDAQNLLDAMVKNWKKWKNNDNTSFLSGFNISLDNPGSLLKQVVLIIKGNQNRKDILWGNFIDELYKLSHIPVGFRTSEGVVLTPWGLLPTDRKTWEHRIRVQLIDILSVGQREKIADVEYLIKNATTKEEGHKLRDSIRGGSVEAWLLLSIDDLYSKLFKARPKWESLVHKNVLFHLSALHDALNVTEKV
jgi:hypothetical protein